MSKRILHGILMIALLAGLLAITPATPVRAATITVNNLTDENDGSCADGDCSLREAVASAGADDSINFSVTGTIVVGSQIIVDKNLTISGPGVDQLTVSGGDSQRVFYISSGAAINISNFSIKNGNASSFSQDGGGIFIGHGTLTANDMLFEGNTGTFGGGAIAANAGNDSIFLTINNSIFNNNSLTSSAGGGGAIGVQYHHQLNMTNVRFEGNSAGSGGAVALLNNSSGTAEISTWDDIVFFDNSASDTSGGAYIDNANLTITNSTFYANTAAAQNGALSIDGNLSNTVSLKNVTISGNSVTSGRAGGLGIYNSTVTVNLNNVTIANNTSTTFGGGIYSNNNDSTININNSILSNNTSGANPDCLLTMDSGDYNLIQNISGCTLPGSATQTISGQSANLSVIATFPNDQMVHAIDDTSPAVNAGNTASCESTDQRGVTRPQYGQCDIGAYELSPNIPTTPTFGDVPLDHPYFADIEILYANGLTAGCSATPLNFCPETIMNRAESAVFMLKGNFGNSYTPPSAPWGTFKDSWAPGTWAEKWAEGMYDEGLTAGCALNPLRFCPWDQTNREQAAVFGLKLMYGNAYSPPPATGTVFADMTDPNYWSTRWTEQAYEDGLLPSCGIGAGGKPNFCPTSLVNRGLAAYMIVRAKSLTMP